MLTWVEPPPEPSESISDPGELLVGYLDFYRETVLRKVDGLSEEESRISRVPSGWNPLELIKHLRHVERRWFRWGFLAEDVDRPWGEFDEGGQAWITLPSDTMAGVLALFREECERSRRIIAEHRLDQRAAGGGRFSADAPIPTLGWIVAHVLQEYARHAGHLDVARELADGVLGE